ncbi:MAG: hypothetical protein AAGB29_03900 [Planctomycetota bacterium]
MNKSTPRPYLCLLAAIFFWPLVVGMARGEVLVGSDADGPMVSFAIDRARLPDTVVVEVARDASQPPQGFEITREASGAWRVVGSDDYGLMYGVLDLGESLRLGLDPVKKARPAIHRRGLKFNIPMDARSPSYDDSGDSARRNIPEVWDREFWHGFLDAIAEHRYNVLTLWCNHPFTTMVELEDYPDVAIPDVAVPAYEVDDWELIQYRKARLQEPGQYEVVKPMSMPEKIEHWRHVMRYAKDRGIDIYFITWNIWLHGAEGKYGISYDQADPDTVAYLRESMKQMVLTYPDLKGFGVTAGEHMNKKLEGEHSVENWLWNTYGEGIVEALAEEPGREFDFIHRVWYTGVDHMMEPFIDKYPGPIDVSFKYARARLYAMPDPPFFNEQLRDQVERNDLRCWMNLRNDDIFNFRWGDPDYTRAFLQNLPPEPTLAGFYMGSDGYVWGREFTSTEPQTPRQLEIDKHWYRFLLWGRLGYDPSLDRSFFEAKLAERFPDVDAASLYSTWQSASKIVPLINQAHWRDWDHQWSVETCMSKKEGYHSVDHFIEFGPFRESGMVSIPQYVESPDAPGLNPFAVADRLDAIADEVDAGLASLRDESTTPTKELRRTLADLSAFAHLGRYYADKLRGSTEVHRFRVAGDPDAQAAAIDHLESARDHWEAYGQVASSLYEPQLLARVSYTDWLGRLLDFADADIDLARNAQPGVFPPSMLHSVGH